MMSILNKYVEDLEADAMKHSNYLSHPLVFIIGAGNPPQYWNIACPFQDEIPEWKVVYLIQGLLNNFNIKIVK